MLTYEDASAGIEWLTETFGFRELPEQRYDGPDGTIGHAELDTGGGVVMLASGNEHYESPKHHREHCEAARKWSAVPWVIDGVQVEVDDVDAHFARAKERGAHLLSEIVEAPYGRLYRVEDLEGHRWMFIQPA